MNRIKTSINSIIGIIMLILSVLNLIISKVDCIYRPKSYAVFGVVYLIISAIIVFFSIKYKNDANKISKKFAVFLPIIALIYVITLAFSFDLSIDYKTYSLLYYEMLFAVTIIFSLIIFFAYCHIIWLKIVVGVISLGVGALFGFVLFITLIFTNFGESKIIQTISSPNGIYVARFITHDSGALGGDTCVRVRNEKPKMLLFLGSVIQNEQQIWTGVWEKEPNIKWEWEDNDTILINDVGYDVK
ncbi:MAG: hypothetical protein II978_05565 [Clostridia bacterium]|nr:hypothetical protein [Clostridia bacterium]